MTVTRSELQAWLDTWNENHAAPSANSVVDFLGIELAPEPTLPVGQRRRSPDGTEAVKTDDGTPDPWRRYVGSGGMWFTDAEVADWEVITDAPECDREHLPDGHVAVDLRGWPDATLRTALVSAADPVAAAARAELTRRGES